jgi:UDP-N-acetylmuramate dehydrogenase
MTDAVNPTGYVLERNVDLRGFNTLHVAARADRVATVQHSKALSAVLALPELRTSPPLVLGEGSNVLFASTSVDLVLRPAFAAVTPLSEDATAARLRVEAGLRWDALVDWTLQRGLCGFENLALIPGLTGAAPIQNIGAYGTEVAEFITTVEAWDLQAHRLERLPASTCAFGYRDSLFKREAGRWIVCAVEFLLPKRRAPALDYAGVREELAAMQAHAPTAAQVAAAIRNLRRRKLPDPAVIGNAGSFFKNPVVERTQALQLGALHPQLPIHPAGDNACKLSAAWLIDAAGWRGYREGDAGISAQHALVLVNHGEASGAQLLAVARKVAAAVHERFGVVLEPEPRIIGAAF